MSRESLDTLRDYLLVTLQPSDMHWLGEILIAHSIGLEHQVAPYTKAEINEMMDEAERQFEAGLYHDDDEVFDRLYKKYNLKELAGENLWEKHQNNRKRLFELMKECQETSDEVKKQIDLNIKHIKE